MVIMLDRFRPVLAIALALLFAGSGVAARYSLAAHLSNGHTIAAAQSNAQAAQHSHGMDHGGAPVAHDHSDHGAAQDPESPVDPGHIACAKCCGICSLPAAVMPSVVPQPLPLVSAMAFAGHAADRSGTILWIDPGIPKRIA